MKKFKKASDIKVGVIGYGGTWNMGKRHLTQMIDAGMTPKTVVELDKSRLVTAENDFPGIETYNSVEKMIKNSDPDLITIITPHNTHGTLGLKCLKAGISVVCEKPFAITVAECDAMIKTARNKNLLLSAYHNRHWDGGILTALDKIRKGETGDVVNIDIHMRNRSGPDDTWRSRKSVSGGILYDWGVHFLEYAFQILGNAGIMEVTGHSKSGFWAKQNKWGKDSNEDEAFATVSFDTGQWINLCVSRVDCRPNPSAIDVIGTEGTLMFNTQEWTLIKPQKNKIVTETGKVQESIWQNYYNNIAGHLCKGEKLVITPELARRPIQIIELAGKSAAQGGKSIKARYK